MDRQLEHKMLKASGENGIYVSPATGIYDAYNHSYIYAIEDSDITLNGGLVNMPIDKTISMLAGQIFYINGETTVKVISGSIGVY